MIIPQKRPLILVVEPSPTLRKIMEITFNQAGGQTILYNEPLQALRAIRQSPFPTPDIAFVDLNVHKKSYRLIRVLKSRSQFKGMVIVAVSRKDSFLSRLRARWAGAIVYLSLPFTTRQLVNVVMTYSRH